MQNDAFDEIIITRNDLLALRWQRGYFKSMGCKSFPPLPTPARTLTDWITDWWHTCQTRFGSPAERLLTQAQSFNLWHTLIQPTPLSIAESAYTAWTLSQDWQIDSHHPLFQRYRDPQTWSTWAHTFMSHCKAHHQVDIHSAIPILIQSNTLPKLPLPKTITLLGFETPTLQEQQLFSYLEQQGCTLQPLTPDDYIPKSTLETFSFQEAHTELSTLAHWALTSLKTHPNTVIGCMIPELSTQRDQVQAIFQSLYHMIYQKPTAPYPWHMPFETQPLLQHPLIQTALDILQLTAPFSLTLLTRLLRSPYIGGTPKEHTHRLQLDRALRTQASLVLLPAQLIQWSQRMHCPHLAWTLQTLQHQPFETKAKRSLQAWVALWEHLLSTWQWPHLAQCSTQESAYYHLFKKALLTFTQSEKSKTPVFYPEALARFISHLKFITIPYQPTPSSAQIQIIDTQHLLNTHYDTCWILNTAALDDAQRTPTNPFIPYALQAHIPTTPTHTSLLNRLSQQSQYVISSTSSAPLPASQHFNLNTPDATAFHLTSYAELHHKKSAAFLWETIEDDFGPSVSHQPIRGGTDLIKKQALCPFRAFADYRLSLKPHSLTLPDAIPSYAEKAIGIHRVLEAIWRHLKTQAALQQLSESQREHLLKTTIHQTLQHFTQKKPTTWTPLFTAAEEKRVYHLLHKWLSLEARRPSFEVKATEFKQTLTLGDLALTFTIDRIDQLSDNSLLLIDYKTSLQPPTLRHWEGHRPHEPQLPLYALSLKDTQGIAWAHLSPETGGKFLGLSHAPLDISGIHTLLTQSAPFSWPDRLNHWQKTLDALAQQFHQGYARVDPKEGTLSCKHCPYPLLCRIHQPHH